MKWTDITESPKTPACFLNLKRPEREQILILAYSPVCISTSCLYAYIDIATCTLQMGPHLTSKIIIYPGTIMKTWTEFFMFIWIIKVHIGTALSNLGGSLKCLFSWLLNMNKCSKRQGRKTWWLFKSVTKGLNLMK